MTAEELRTLFRDYAGPTKARRFALQLRADKQSESSLSYRQRRTDLRFWQQQLWDQFSQQYAGVPRDLGPIQDALLWCDVHHLPLEDGQAIPGNGFLSFGPVREEQFPFGQGFWTIVCPACVAACRQWIFDSR